MRISDWSSDVISSDLLPEVNQPLAPRLLHEAVRALPDRLLAVALLRCHHNFRCFPSAHRLPLIPKNKRYMGQGKKAWHPRRYELTQTGILHRRIPCSLLRTKQPGSRSEDRRVGKESVGTCRHRWTTYHQKNKQNKRIHIDI